MTNQNNQLDFDVLPHPEGWGFLPVQGVELWYRHRKRGRTPSYFCYSSGQRPAHSPRRETLARRMLHNTLPSESSCGIGDETPNYPPDKGAINSQTSPLIRGARGVDFERSTV